MLTKVGTYVGRILNGTKPADLLVAQASKFELVIKNQAARMLGPCSSSRGEPGHRPRPSAVRVPVEDAANAAIWGRPILLPSHSLANPGRVWKITLSKTLRLPIPHELMSSVGAGVNVQVPNPLHRRRPETAPTALQKAYSDNQGETGSGWAAGGRT